MATLVGAISASSTTNNAALSTSSFVPSANDLLVAIAHVSGQASGGTFTDSQSLGWTTVLSVLDASSANTMVVAVANKLAANASMTVTFTPAGSPTSTGAQMSIIRVGGVTRTGASAVRQSKSQANQAAGTPAPVFSSAALTGNACIGAVANSTNTATMTPPTSWTEFHDIGYNTPTTGLETAGIASGFTGTTVTWGSASASAFASAILEIDTTAPPRSDGWQAFHPDLAQRAAARRTANPGSFGDQPLNQPPAPPQLPTGFDPEADVYQGRKRETDAALIDQVLTLAVLAAPPVGYDLCYFPSAVAAPRKLTQTVGDMTPVFVSAATPSHLAGPDASYADAAAPWAGFPVSSPFNPLTPFDGFGFVTLPAVPTRHQAAPGFVEPYTTFVAAAAFVTSPRDYIALPDVRTPHRAAPPWTDTPPFKPPAATAQNPLGWIAEAPDRAGRRWTPPGWTFTTEFKPLAATALNPLGWWAEAPDHIIRRVTPLGWTFTPENQPPAATSANPLGWGAEAPDRAARRGIRPDPGQSETPLNRPATPLVLVPLGFVTVHTDRAPKRPTDPGVFVETLRAPAQPLAPNGWFVIHPDTPARPRPSPASFVDAPVTRSVVVEVPWGLSAVVPDERPRHVGASPGVLEEAAPVPPQPQAPTGWSVVAPDRPTGRRPPSWVMETVWVISTPPVASFSILVIDAADLVRPWLGATQATVPWLSVASLVRPWLDAHQLTVPWLDAADLVRPWAVQAQGGRSSL